MRRWWRWLGRVVAGAVVLGMALVAACAWRLASGPIEVAVLTPRLERALSRPDGSLLTRIATSQIAWDAREREIDLVVRELSVDAAGEELLHLPVASLRFSAWDLLAGRLVLRAVDLPGPRLTVRRDPAGTLRLGFEGDTTAELPLARFLPALIAPRPGDPLAELRRLEVSGGSVTMTTEAGPAWRLSGVDWVLTRTPAALQISGACQYESGATAMPIQVDGVIDAAADPATFAANVTTGALAPRDVLVFWPAGVASRVYDWLNTRVESGGARDLRLELRGRIAGDGGIDVDGVDGRFEFAGMTVRPLDGVPPVTGVTGRATFDRNRWRFQVARGQTAGLDIVDATLNIASGDPAAVTMRVAVRGAIERVLPLLRQYARSEAFVAAPVTGRLDASLTIDLAPGRAFDPQRDVSARGRLQDVACPDVVGHRSLREGAFTFEVARRVLVARGRATLDGVPGDLAITTPIGRYAPEIEVNARLDAAARARLGLDVRPWVDGTTAVKSKVTLDERSGVAAVSADLGDAVLSIPALGMQKPAGAAGIAEARLRMDGGVIRAIDDAVLRYGATQLRGRAGFDRAGTLASLDLGGTLGPVPGRKSPSGVTLRVAPGPTRRTITASTDDVDLLFRALDMTADAEGGRLRFDGTLAPGPGLALEGQAEARDFALASAPVLARLLAMASVPGVTTLFTGRGLPVTRLAARIDYRPPTTTLTDGVLESPSLGMRLAGTVDTGGAVAFQGSLVPSYYGLNTLAGRVPVLGRVITGSKREGLQVFAFDVRGTVAAPRITVDPVSSLVPGAVRDLFKLLPRPRVPVPSRSNARP